MNDEFDDLILFEVAKNISVGNDAAYTDLIRGLPEWAVLQCAKDPWHREALGYTSRGAPKDDPEYSFAMRLDEADDDMVPRMILNMIDVDDPAFFSTKQITSALKFIYENADQGRKVLIHCNQGRSRGPSIAMLYLAIVEHVEKGAMPSFHGSAKRFKDRYPEYDPALGIKGHLEKYWYFYLEGWQALGQWKKEN